MPARSSNPTISLSERLLSDRQPEKLRKWLCLSLLFHGLFIVSLFIVPFLPSRRSVNAPVYTVDLVGGEKIGGNIAGTELRPAPTPKEAAKEKPAAPPPPAKEAKKIEKPEKVEKPKPAEKLIPDKLAKDTAKKEPVKKESLAETKREKKSTEESLESVRERIMQSAVERARNRSESAQKTAKGDLLSTGPGEGEGAAALGPGGRGGGVVKGVDFIVYQNRIFQTIKDNWAWVGQRGNIKVTVHFGIRENGDIFGLKVVRPSGDPSYDDSVVRALRKSSPLPPPPEEYRKDFSDVELTFHPKDLGA